MADRLVRLWPPDLGRYCPAGHTPLVETLPIATLCTILAVLVSLLAARPVCAVGSLNWLVRSFSSPRAR